MCVSSRCKFSFSGWRLFCVLVFNIETHTQQQALQITSSSFDIELDSLFYTVTDNNLVLKLILGWGGIDGWMDGLDIYHNQTPTKAIYWLNPGIVLFFTHEFLLMIQETLRAIANNWDSTPLKCECNICTAGECQQRVTTTIVNLRRE